MANFTETVWASQIRKTTEDYILTHTLAEVRDFIKEHGEVEEDEGEYARFIPRDGKHKFVKGKTYDMCGSEFRYDEFIITEDGRVFLAVSLMTNIEVIDVEEEKAEEEEMEEVVKAYHDGNIEVVDIDEMLDVDEVEFKEVEELKNAMSSNVNVRFFYVPSLRIICRYADC